LSILVIHFPIIESIAVSHYLLYPGNASDGLSAKFGPGPWIVLGVNGLGKSTLLLLLRHMLVGNTRVRPAGFTGEVKSEVLETDPRTFAVRVADGARNAVAVATVRIGDSRFSIARRLDTLALVEFIDLGTSARIAGEDEEPFRKAIGDAFGIVDFANVIRVIDRLVFAFLDSDSFLIWDTASQYEIFRALILAPEDAGRLRALEATIVSADSSARNLNAVIFGIVKRQERESSRQANAADTRAKLAEAVADFNSAQEREFELQRKFEQAEVGRSDARTRFLRSERAADDAEKAYEQAKFSTLREALTQATPTQQYLIVKLLTERKCIACGSSAPELANKLERRHTQEECVVCGAPLKKTKIRSGTQSLLRRARDAYSTLEIAREAFTNARREFERAEEAHAESFALAQSARDKVDLMQKKVAALTRRLPKADRLAVSRERSRIEALRSEVVNFRKERDDAEEEIAGLIAKMRDGVEGIRSQIEGKFQNRAKQFFTEKVRLVYASRQDRIGQQGRRFEFPAFEMEMTSGATDGRFSRRTIDSVSFSQRQYLDLLFRIAVMEVVGAGPYTLIVDGPESSLDAVFAERAGRLFAQLASPARKNGNSLIAACNVVDGAFIPSVLHSFSSESERRKRLINLLEVAAPTAALRDLSAEYQSAVHRILSQSRPN
jgi:energy-coupling factor transporter ATP-binding protein EcfA2